MAKPVITHWLATFKDGDFTIKKGIRGELTERTCRDHIKLQQNGGHLPNLPYELKKLDKPIAPPAETQQKLAEFYALPEVKGGKKKDEQVV